jgi:hypothetical protein
MGLLIPSPCPARLDENPTTSQHGGTLPFLDVLPQSRKKRKEEGGMGSRWGEGEEGRRPEGF